MFKHIRDMTILMSTSRLFQLTLYTATGLVETFYSTENTPCVLINTFILQTYRLLDMCCCRNDDKKRMLSSAIIKNYNLQH